jgi:hypothetical protein
MNNKIVVTGCSYTDHADWPEALFSQDIIVNLGKSGAGNRYISDSITRSIDPKDPPDFVFVLFSGVNRREVIVPINSKTKKIADLYRFYGILDDSIYIFSGGDKYNKSIVDCYNRIKDLELWPAINSCDEFLELPAIIKQECIQRGIIPFADWSIDQLVHSALMINYFLNPTFLQTQTYRAIIDCQTFLEKHNIPYVFSFFYNPFDWDYSKQFGCLDKKHILYQQVNWDKFITQFPFETGIEFELLDEDGVHLSKQGQLRWASQIAKTVNKELKSDKSDSSYIFKYFKRN